MSQNRAGICAVIAEESVESARAALREAALCADLAEVRLDYLNDFDFTRPENLRALLEDKPLPVIITCRSSSEGGRQQVAEDARIRLLIGGAQWADWCDIESSSFEQAANLSPDYSRLIVSYHNFSETPSDIETVYEKLSHLPTAVCKIATRANRYADSVSILRLLDRARSEGKNLIALAMGEAGVITRVMSLARGGFLTFGSLSIGRESAPGQLTCRELKHLYRVDSLSPKTAITGIIGKPVHHSASPAMHSAAFEAMSLDMVYLPFEVDDLGEFFDSIQSERVSGLSVTIPHKVAVMSLMDEIDETAQKIGAVNTVVMRDGRLSGYNTDAAGAMEPLEKICDLKRESCAVLGAGGAARAVVCGLVERGAAVTVFARDTERAQTLAESFGVRVLPFSEFAASRATIVINTTPVGMRGHSEDQSPVPRASLGDRRIVYDLVYNPLETRFLRDAKEEGCCVVTGLDMLIAQAALQFRLWTGLDAPAELMRRAALESILA
ncbi:MAG: shikimate dehydrogenase [Acidobacteriota bacterium]